MGISEKLMNIQCNLVATKGQYNSFGKYNYRSCEDILEAVKPHLKEYKCTLTFEDDLIQVGERIYIKTYAILKDIESGEFEKVPGIAREEENKKGMDGSQVTGASSSYARKYALNALFCIDDNKDSDSTNTHGKDKSDTSDKNKSDKPMTNSKCLSDAQIKRLLAIANAAGYGIDVVKKHALNKYNVIELNLLTKSQYDELCEGFEKLKK